MAHGLEDIVDGTRERPIGNANEVAVSWVKSNESDIDGNRKETIAWTYHMHHCKRHVDDAKRHLRT